MDEPVDDLPEIPAPDTVPPADKTAAGLAAEADADLRKLRAMGPMSFFSFDRLYFPVIARYVFAIMVVVIFVIAIITAISGVVTMFSVGVLAGIAVIGAALVGGLVSLVYLRFGFEFLLVGFQINEKMGKIARKLGADDAER